MALNPTVYGDNPQQPSIAAEVYVPDRLIAGNLKLVTQQGIVSNGGTPAVLIRGTVMGLASSSTYSGKWIVSKSTSTDGSQVPRGILVDVTDVSTGDQLDSDLYVFGEFNSQALIYDASWSSLAALIAAVNSGNPGLFIKTVSAGLTQQPET